MPPVYTFARNDNEILEELLKVFNAPRGTAREQWGMQAEIVVEPAGWDALWKLSKDFCKKFEVRFPCIAVVTVTLVDFEGLSACVELLRVQHETVLLPAIVDDVPLIELWPTQVQREQCVNALATADFIDLLRFYYNNIWMPWDDQVLPTTIEQRMALWSDLHNGTIPNVMARSITMLRSDSIKTHEKLNQLDSSLCIDAGDEDSLLPPSYISTCAEMHARLESLMAKWTIYENPLIREQYLLSYKSKCHKDRNNRNMVALWKGGDLKEFEEMSQFLRRRVSGGQTLSIMVSAEEALAMAPEEVVLCSSSYEMPDFPLSNIRVSSFKGSVLKASEMRSSLLVLSEDCSLRDLTLHCSQVSNAVVVRSGCLRIANCALLDDSKSYQTDFVQGIVAMAGAKVLIENCTFDNFYSGIVVHNGAQVELRGCALKKCGVGIQMYSGASVTLDQTSITECAEQSVRCELDIDTSTSESGLGIEGLTILPNCHIGSGDLLKEILVARQDVNLM